MQTWPYTVDDAGRTRQLIALGVDRIITNRPYMLAGVLAEKHGQREAV